MPISLADIPSIDLTGGGLEESPVAFLLGVAKVWNVTGTIVLERDKTRKAIHFLQGLPVYCESNLSGESLRQVLYKSGKIDLDTLGRIEKVIEKGRGGEEKALLDLGVLDEKSRYFHLQEQSRKRILSLFAWATGRYSFSPTEDFLDQVELFDMDPLGVIYEGISAHQTLDMPRLVQEASSSTVTVSENMDDINTFITRCYPGSNPDWESIAGKQLGVVLPLLGPDISRMIELAFILIVSGALLLEGWRPGQLKPPPKLPYDSGEGLIDFGNDTDVDDAPFIPPDISAGDPWNGDAESPDLEDNSEPIPQAVMPDDSNAGHDARKTSKPPNKPGPPPVAPWKKNKPNLRNIVSPVIKPRSTEKGHRPQGPKVQPVIKRRAEKQDKPEKIETSKLPAPPKDITRRAATDTSLERRFQKMLEIVRSGDIFDILDVDEFSDRAEIKKAYFYRHSQYHPDRKTALGPDGEKIVEEIHQGLRKAYDILLDPDKRHEYQTRFFTLEKQKAWSLDLRKKLAEKQFRRGMWYLSQRRPDLAVDFFDMSMNLDTECAPYYAFLGWSMYASRRESAEKCMSFIRTALDINSRYAEAFLFLGWINKNLENVKKARECFEQALKHAPENKFARQELEGTRPSANGDGGLIGRFFRK